MREETILHNALRGHSGGHVDCQARHEGWYCASCEAFYTKKELDDEHRCPVHGTPCSPESEENVFLLFAIGLIAGVLAYTTSFIVTSRTGCLGCFALFSLLGQPLFTGIALGWAKPNRRLPSHLITVLLVWILLLVGGAIAFSSILAALGGEQAPLARVFLLVVCLPTALCAAILLGLAGLILGRTCIRVFMRLREGTASSFLIALAAILLTELVYISIFQDVFSVITAKVELIQNGQEAPDLAPALFDIETRAALYNSVALFRVYEGNKVAAQRLFDKSRRWIDRAPRTERGKLLGELWWTLESAAIDWVRLGKADRGREAFAMDLKLHEGSSSSTYRGVADAQRTAGLSADAQATDALISEMKRREEAAPPTPAAKQ